MDIKMKNTNALLFQTVASVRFAEHNHVTPFQNTRLQ
jgi:hypothetical protein